MRRAAVLLSLALLFSGCAKGSSEPGSSEPLATDALAQLDSVTWPSSQDDVLSLFRQVPDRIGDHDRVNMGMSTFGATYGSQNPNNADIMMYAMTLDEAGIATPTSDPLGELRATMSDVSGAREESSSPGGDNRSAYLAVVAPVNPNKPTDLTHVIDWIPPQQTWLYMVGAKDVDDRDAALLSMIEATKTSGTPTPAETAPLGLGEVAWPKDAAGAKALLAAMPDSIAGLPKGQIEYGTSLTYGDGTAGSEPIQIVVSPVPGNHRKDIATMPFVMIGMGYPVGQVESSNDDPGSQLVWFEAKVGSPTPGGSGGYAIAWAPTDGGVAYAVITQTADLRGAAVEAMARGV